MNECVANGSNPMELMIPSVMAGSSSSKEEEIKIWTSYITTKSNKINIALLPKQVHHLHRRVVEKGKVKKRKAVINGEEPITKQQTIVSVNGVRSGAQGITTVSKGGERVASKSVAKRTSANDTSETKRPTAERVAGVKSRSKETFKEVELNLGRSARKAWMERYGEVLREITPFGDSYGTIGTRL